MEHALRQMIVGYRISQAIFVAVKLGIPDVLDDRGRSGEELAAETRVDRDALHRLLVVLADSGVLRETAPAHFALTAMGGLLRKGGAVRDSVILATEVFWPAYSELLYTVRTGRSGVERAFGMPIYDYLARNPEVDAAYTAIMTAATTTMAAALIGSYDFSGIGTVVDVGGGQGALLTAILKAHPHLRGILFDRSAAVAKAREALVAQDVAARCEVVAGDFFDDLPADNDVYILKWVISEWADERATVILKNCRRAMTTRGRVLVMDPLDLPSNALFNLNMLVTWNGGRVRSPAELTALFANAGLRVERIIPTQSQMSIVEGRPA